MLDRTQLKDVLGSSRADLARLVPEFAEPAAANGGSATFAPGRMFELVLGVLHRVALRRPVLLAIEDLHWADRSTRELLNFLAHNIRTGLLLVLTYRSDELHRRHALRPFLAELQRGGRVERLDLGPLGTEEMTELVGQILGEPPPPAMVAEIQARSEGNPFYVEELLTARREGMGFSSSLHDLLLTRVHALSEGTQQLLGIAAIAGRRVDHQLLADVSGLPPEELIGPLREAVDHHVLATETGPFDAEAYAFRHGLLQEAIYGDLLAVQRGRMHSAFARAMARRIEARDGTPEPTTAAEIAQLAYHWYAAHELGPALLTYVHAGMAAEASSAPAEAQQHYERAIELWDRVPPEVIGRSPMDRITLLERAAETASLGFEPARAITLVDLALAALGPDNPLRRGLLLERRARSHWAAGDTTEGMASIEQAVAAVAGQPPSAQRARVLAAHGHMLLLLSRLPESSARCEEAVAAAREVGAREVEGYALNTRGTAQAALGYLDEGIAELHEAIRIAEEVNNAEDLCRAYNNLTAVCNQSGRLAESLAASVAGIDAARRFGLMRSFGATALAAAATAQQLLGDWAEADRYLEEVFSLDLPPMASAQALRIRSGLRLQRGELAPADADAVLAVQAAPQRDPQHVVAVCMTLADVALWSDRPIEGRAEVARGLAAMAGATQPSLVVRLCAVGLSLEAELAEQARARYEDDDRDAAVDTGRGLIERARSAVVGAGQLMPVVAAMLAKAEAEWTRVTGHADAKLWAAAGDAWAALAVPFETSYARWRQVQAHLTSGAPREQIEGTLRESWQLATRLGAARLVSEAESLARRARISLPTASRQPSPTPETRPDSAEAFGLTPREREVLGLVAGGSTNRQIAERLYISDKTASVHVSNILSKLGVANRGEAAAVAHRLGLTA
jgi:DNA-binding CsgD family transcriptional regulator/tetratricopeptide (TPR) repeat protein